MAITKTSSQNGSGRYIDFADPKPDQFTYADISRGLSRECRFNGQTFEHYSVAQHSVLASLLVPKEFALEALVHDGSEAFLRDLCTPVKALLPDYRRIEKIVQGTVHEYFGLPRDLPIEAKQAVKKVDTLLTATERAQLMPTDDREWPGISETPLDLRIEPMSEAAACAYFTDRLISIMEDKPFLMEIDLWSKQHDEWASRQLQADNEAAAAPMRRVRPAA